MILKLLLMLMISSSLSQIGTWTRISGELYSILNDQGSVNEIPQYWNPGFASDNQGTGYLFGGSKESQRIVSGWNDVTDYVYRVNLDSGNVTRIYGNSFRYVPSSLPNINTPSKILGCPPKEGAALWYSKYDDSLYTFGGYSTYKKCVGNDLWKFNLSALEWTWISGDLNCTASGRKPLAGAKGVFAAGNRPGAKLTPSYWKSDSEKRLFVFGGRGAYSDSVFSTNANLPNQYWDHGDDVWEYDLVNQQWAWIKGSLFRSALALSTGNSDLLTPGWSVEATFGTDIDDNLWVIGSGNSGSYLLWKFTNKFRSWEPVSEINIEGTPATRRFGAIFHIGRNTLIVAGGFDIFSMNNRYQDIWMFEKQSKKWRFISGFESYNNIVTNITNNDGVNIPGIGNSSSSMILPGLIGFARFNWKRSIYIMGGYVATFYNPFFRFTICSESQYLKNFSCTSCSYGRIASDESTKALDSCDVLCEPGSSWNGNVCVNCTAGKFVYRGEYSACESCASGLYSSNLDRNEACSACSPGKFSSGFGSVECLSCQSGFYSQSSGLSQCFECSIGSYAKDDGSTICDLCEVGRYSANINSTICGECGLNAQTNEKGALSKKACVCLAGYYGEPYNDIGCKKCSDLAGMSCPTNSSLPRLDQGYFRSPSDPGSALECIPNEACLPTSGDSLSTQCASGYTGWICGSCDLQFYKLGSKCSACPSIISRVFIYLAFFVLLLIGLWKFATLQSYTSIVDFRIVIFWVQMFALFPQLSNSWPTELSKFFRYISFVNLDLELSSPECSIRIGFWGKFYAKLFTPILFMSAYVIRLMYVTFVKKSDLISKDVLIQKLEFIYVLVVSTFFALIFSTLASAFGCKSQIDGSYVLQSEPSILCYEGEWMRVHLPLIIIFILLYIIFFFLILFKIYRRIRGSAKLSIISIEESHGAVRYLTRSYRYSTYWWEIVVISKRIAIIFFGVLNAGSKNSEIYFAMFVVLLVFLLLDIVAFPYETRSMMRLSLMWNSLALLFFMADGFIFKSAYASSDTKLAFSIVIILMFGILVILSFIRLYKSKVRKPRRREFDGKISGFDQESSTLMLECKTDKVVLDAIISQQLANPRVNINLKWNSNKSSSPEALNANRVSSVLSTSTTTAVWEIPRITRDSIAVTSRQRQPNASSGIQLI